MSDEDKEVLHPKMEVRKVQPWAAIPVCECGKDLLNIPGKDHFDSIECSCGKVYQLNPWCFMINYPSSDDGLKQWAARFDGVIKP